ATVPVLDSVPAPVGQLADTGAAAPEVRGTQPLDAAATPSASITPTPSGTSIDAQHNAGVVASGGTIVFAEPAPSGANDLYTAGHYTDYGVALSTSPTATDISVTQPIDNTATDVASVDAPTATPSAIQPI